MIIREQNFGESRNEFIDLSTSEKVSPTLQHCPQKSLSKLKNHKRRRSYKGMNLQRRKAPRLQTNSKIYINKYNQREEIVKYDL